MFTQDFFFSVIKLQPRTDDADASVRLKARQLSDYENSLVFSRYSKNTITPETKKNTTLLRSSSNNRSSKCRLIFIEDCKSNDTHSALGARLSRAAQPNGSIGDDLTNPSSPILHRCPAGLISAIVDDRQLHDRARTVGTIIEFIRLSSPPICGRSWNLGLLRDARDELVRAHNGTLCCTPIKAPARGYNRRLINRALQNSSSGL